MRLSRRVLLVGGLGVLASGCGGDRWRANSPMELRYRGQPDIFARVLITLRELGYPVQEQDGRAGYVRIVAKTAAPSSWFTFRFYRRTIVVRSYGALVRDNDTVRRTALHLEMEHLVKELQARLDRA
jgi:hypothetical protein